MRISPSRRSRLFAATVSVSLASLTASVTAYAVPGRSAPAPNVVEGTVRTVDGRPVRGATIRVAGATGAARGTSIKATTDANGRYSVRVPLGHYNVDGFMDLEYGDQTYKELWLDRGNAPCGRVMSDKGIVRNFTLRLSGAKRCFNIGNSDNPDAWNGAYITAMTSEFPDDAVITFKLTPLGRLADGTAGRALTIVRTGAALKKGGGPIDNTSFLYDIPIGRYRIVADVRYANGERSGTTLELRDGGQTSGETLEIAFQANVFGGGIRPVGIGVRPGDTGNRSARQRAPEPDTPKAEPPRTAVAPSPSPAVAAELPRGRYLCSYRSQYAGEMPTGKSITIKAGGRYEAYGSNGTYSIDPRTGAVRWTGPLGDGVVSATFAKRNGVPVITVVGGVASDDPDRTNTCVLNDS